jgi:hypothetical protein
MIRRLILLCAIAVLSVVQLRADVDVPRLLEALRMKETGLRWDGQPGPAGELSDYQLTAGVWRQHMAPRPFSEARDPALARTCAVKHIDWLVAQIQRRGLTITPQRVATAWHFGISHAARRTRWGMEAANLYYDITRNASDCDAHAHQSGYFPLQGSRAEQRPFVR